MKIRGISVVVACFISWVHVIVSSRFSLYQLTTENTCVSDVMPFPGPVRSVLECAAGCLNESYRCYNNEMSTCMCCSATSPSGPSTTKCYRRQACFNGWIKAGGLCLFAHLELLNFTECKKVCHDTDGKILTPENLEQISDAMTLIEMKPGTLDEEERYWLGVVANTTEPNRPWYYSDTGDVVPYFNWRLPWEPNGHTTPIKEYCVFGKDDTRWADVLCHKKLSCVCQI